MIDNFELSQANAKLILELSQAASISPGDLINFFIMQGAQVCIAAADITSNMNEIRPTIMNNPQAEYLCRIMFQGYLAGLKAQADKVLMKPN